MLRIAPVLVAIPLVVAFGFAEGLWTHRWRPSLELEQAADRLAHVPLNVGEWEGEEQELDPRQVVKAELSGHLLRQYVHRSTGTTLSVLLVCGRPGPVSVHTPDVCYRGIGYSLVAPPARHTVRAAPPAKPAPFWAGNFQKEQAAIPERLRILWSWTATGDWSAADNPRVTFARASTLYKLYVIRQVVDAKEPLEKDPSVEFLSQFLPAVQPCLFATPAAD